MKFKALAIVLAAAIGSTAVAQDNVTCNRGTECQAPGNNDKMYRPQSFTDYAFEGILLSVDQQAKVDALNAEMKAKREQAAAERQLNRDAKKDCKKDDCKKDKKDCKKDCKKDDCKKDKKDCKKDCKKGDRKGDGPRARAMEGRKDYIQKVKEILTPEQYTTFLENIVFMPEQSKGPRPGKDFRGGRDRMMKKDCPAGAKECPAPRAK